MRKGMRAFSSLVAALAICLCFAFIASAQKAAAPSTPDVEERNVAVRVSVLDPLGRFYSLLEKESFRIYEDNVEQPILNFSRQSEPISLGLLWDISRSMKDENDPRIDYVIMYLLRSLTPEDECFMVAFDRHIRPIQLDAEKSFAQQEKELLRDTKSVSCTALNDTIIYGIDSFKSAKHSRKILVVLSDGEDNCSRHSGSDLRKAARQTDVQIYALTISDTLGLGRWAMREIADLTGGRIFPMDLFSDAENAVDSLRKEFHSSYSLCYSVPGKKKSGKWRNNRIRLKPPKGTPKLTLHYRQGYYSSDN